MSDKETSKEATDDKEKSETPSNIFVIDNGGDSRSRLRTIEMCGTLGEDELSAVLYSLLSYEQAYLDEVANDAPPQPINFYISTYGGDALGMFAIYDLMRQVRKECELVTVGLGKVMSAGVLLLAAGTKGQRKIGKNTRVMLHGVQASHYGSLASWENELEELHWIQERMFASLIEETKITKRYVNKMLHSKLDVYLSAEEAVKLGIADIII